MTSDPDVNDLLNSLSPIGQMAFAMTILVQIAKRAEAASSPVTGHSTIEEIAATAHAKLKADG